MRLGLLFHHLFDSTDDLVHASSQGFLDERFQQEWNLRVGLDLQVGMRLVRAVDQERGHAGDLLVRVDGVGDAGVGYRLFELDHAIDHGGAEAESVLRGGDVGHLLDLLESRTGSVAEGTEEGE